MIVSRGFRGIAFTVPSSAPGTPDEGILRRDRRGSRSGTTSGLVRSLLDFRVPFGVGDHGAGALGLLSVLVGR